MAPKIFITGITGYIAGDAFYTIHRAHPDYSYAALVRSEEKASKVRAAYPDVRIVIGSLDDSAIIEEEASKADIVLHAADASDHEPAARAITAGLLKTHTPSNPAFWLHTGGTGILTYFDSSRDRFGEPPDRFFNDDAGVHDLTTLPDEAFHRNVDKLVLEAGTKHADVIKTALVCPPTIYGLGRGPVSGRGRQVYELTRLILKEGYIPLVGEGKAEWDNVHISDLSEVYSLLVDAAVQKNLDPEIWGPKGYFLVENGHHVWGELAREIAKRAGEMGVIDKKAQEKKLSKDEAWEVADFQALSWGLSSRGKAERARRVLGWRPRERRLEEEVPKIIVEEKGRLV